MTSLELAVDSISLDLILEQLDLAEWMSDWLIEHRSLTKEDVYSIDPREVGLRAISLRSREAEEVLRAEYGVLDPLLYHDDD